MLMIQRVIRESDSENNEHEIDPRWAKLKDLKK